MSRFHQLNRPKPNSRYLPVVNYSPKWTPPHLLEWYSSISEVIFINQFLNKDSKKIRTCGHFLFQQLGLCELLQPFHSSGRLTADQLRDSSLGETIGTRVALALDRWLREPAYSVHHRHVRVGTLVTRLIRIASDRLAAHEATLAGNLSFV